MKIVLGVSGGIAAYKSPELVRRLQDAGADVRVILTPNAARFVSPLSLAAVSNHGVIVVGPTVAEAFDSMYYLERACRLQVLARSMGGRLKPVRPEVVKETYRLILADAPKYSAAHFEALKRILEREEPAYSR